jgi:hypothetical protein
VSGQTIAGTITSAGEQVKYTFAVTAGESFKASVGDATSTSTFEPYLTVYGPNGAEINTGGGGYSTNSSGEVDVASAPAAGTYTIVVQSYGGAQIGGTYDVEVVGAPATQAANAGGNGAPITSGETEAGTISHDGDLEVYTFSASKGDSFEATISDATPSSTFEPYITLYGPNGDEINTGGGGYDTNTSGEVDITSAPLLGTYTIVVQSYGGAQIGGAYTVSLSGNIHPVNPTSLTISGLAAQTATAGTSKSFTLGSFTETNATGPYTATVVWGDGTANTTIDLTAAGTIPATAHTYTTSGSKTVTVTVKDSDGHTSNSPTFAVTVAAGAAAKLVVGQQPTTGTAGVALSPVITVDVEDADGNLVTTNTSTITLALDTYPTGGAITGTVAVKAVAGVATFTGISLKVGGAYTLKATDGTLTAAVTKSITIAAATGSISGTVFNDANGDKKLDDGELGLGGYVVFIDLKGTGTFATGDPTATTAVNGTFSFTDLVAGTYKLDVEPVSGASLTTTELTIVLTAGEVSSGNLFGEKAIS